MHPFQLEQLVRKLDARVTRMEQLLPTLATKDDLEGVRRHAVMLIEALRDDIRLLAEHVLATRMQLDRIEQRLN